MSRPSIPSEIKRTLRKEAGYGCCFCGYPFYDYHHINPWARKNHHDPDDLMLVCPNHHRECREGISEDDQRSAKAVPVNIQNGLTYGKLYIGKRQLVIDIGSNIVEGTPTIFSDVTSNKPIMSTHISKNGILNLSCQLFDNSRQLIGVIENNEWVVQSNDVWDLEAQPKYATFRLAKGDIALRIDARNDPVLVTGKWYLKNLAIKAQPSKLKVDSTEYSGNHIQNCDAAFSF